MSRDPRREPRVGDVLLRLLPQGPRIAVVDRHFGGTEVRYVEHAPDGRVTSIAATFNDSWERGFAHAQVLDAVPWETAR